jgi:hypothetical protein
MKPCHLGYICELMADIKTNKWGEKICQSENACQEWALSWGLPYTYNPEERKLTVEFRPTRYYWMKETHYRNELSTEPMAIIGQDCKIDGMKFGLSMAAAEQMLSENEGNELDVKEIIIQALTQEGWAEAISIGMQPKITRDGITAVMPTLSRMLGRFKNLIAEKLNGYQTHTKVSQTQTKHNLNTV